MKNNARLMFTFQVIASILLSSAAFAQESGTWATKSSTGFTPRSDLASSAVSNKIYVIGGDDNAGNPTSIVEVYDVVTGTWSAPSTTGTFVVRDGLTTAVINGKIYVMGGYNGTAYAVNKLDVFDPATNAWTSPTTTGTFTGRGGLTSGVVNGKIYVIGGTNAGPNTLVSAVEVFDPATNTWSTATTTGTFTPRTYLTASVVNGKIYVMGGINGSGTALNTLEVFDPATNIWSTPTTTGTFSPRLDLASAVINGKIYVIGGQKGNSYLNTFEVFDPATNIWSTPATTGTFTSRNGLGASVVNGVIYAMGGYNGYTLNTNEAYTPNVSTVPGTLTVANSQLNFGTHDYTKDSILTGIVRNTSTTAVSIDQTTITGSNSGDFKILSNTKQANLPYPLQPGDSIGFAIQYIAPSATESDNAILRILFDGSSDSVRTISLNGSSQKPAAPKPGYITVAVSQIDFGTHDYGKDSIITLTATNPSSTYVLVDQPKISGSNASDFIVVSNTKNALIFPYKLMAGDNIGFLLEYIAPSTTETDQAILQIFFAASSDSVRSVTLTGSARKPTTNDVTQTDKIGSSINVFPNPVKSEIHINYSISHHCNVTCSLFDMSGKVIMNLVNETHDAGSYEKITELRSLANGLYILRLSAGGESISKVIEIVK